MQASSSELHLDGEGQRWEPVVFNGTGTEYFKIWIVNLFLSILTLGIYSAWAKVRSRRYFYGNTMLDGASFEYHATPIMILKGRLIAVSFLLLAVFAGYIHPAAELFFLILVALLAPWVIWRSLIFNAKMSSYRNVRFGFGSRVMPLYLYLLLVPLAPLLIAAIVLGIQYLSGTIEFPSSVETESANSAAMILTSTIAMAVGAIYLLVPFIQKSINSYYFNGHMFGQGKFRARLQTYKYYMIYLKLLGIMVVGSLAIGVIVSFIVGFINMDLQSRLSSPGTEIATSAGTIFGFLMLIPLIAIATWLKAYMQSRFRNYSLGQLKLESVATFRSGIKVNKLFWLQFSNVLMLICSIGLAYPWAVIRVTRYKLSTIDAQFFGDTDQFVTQMQSRQSALGEEIGEAFDLDLDLGI
ncbi:MAG: YjgN family protein [bacterium]